MVQFLLLVAAQGVAMTQEGFQEHDAGIDRSTDVSIRSGMATTNPKRRAQSREERVSRTYRLRLSKLEAAKRALGAATATEAIEMALDLAVFQRELIEGHRRMFGISITSPDPVR
jgi:hypothetical protein